LGETSLELASRNGDGVVNDIVEGMGANKAKKTVDVNGKNVTMDSNTFNPDFVDPKTGLTNTERMKQGLAPIGTDGKSVNIHHIDQTNTGSVKEITATQHQKNYKELHKNTGQNPSKIDRNAFNKWRKEYWKWRANDLK